MQFFNALPAAKTTAVVAALPPRSIPLPASAYNAPTPSGSTHQPQSTPVQAVSGLVSNLERAMEINKEKRNN
jgi:hypothetical protein